MTRTGVVLIGLSTRTGPAWPLQTGPFRLAQGRVKGPKGAGSWAPLPPLAPTPWPPLAALVAPPLPPSIPPPLHSRPLLPR